MTRATSSTSYTFHLAAKTGPLPEKPFVALVDGAQTPLLPLDLPPGLKGQARERVARRQLADGLAINPQETAIRPFSQKQHSAAWDRILITDAQMVEQWRKQFEPAGQRCLAILPDYLALPAAADLWVLEVSEHITKARLGLDDGFSIETPLALDILRKSPPPKAVLRLGDAADDLDVVLAELGVPICKDTKTLKSKKIKPPQIFEQGELNYDLRNNPAAAYDSMRRSLTAWRAPVILAAVGFGLWATSSLIALNDVQNITKEIRLATVEDVRQNFVPTGPILDIQTQVNQTLAAQKARSGQVDDRLSPLDLLKTAGTVFQAQSALLQTASFTQDSGVAVALSLVDFSVLDRLVEQLEATGIQVEIAQSSASDDGGISATLGLKDKSGGGQP